MYKLKEKEMSSPARPSFTQSYKQNPTWKKLVTTENKWLDITIKNLLKGEAKSVQLVYWYLRYVDVENLGFAYPAQSTIAKAKKLDRRTVIRALARLEVLGLIIRWKKARHSFYIFSLPIDLQKPKTELEKAKKECSGVVDNLREKTLKFRLENPKVTQFATCECHTNNNMNIKRIENLPFSSEDPIKDLFRLRVEAGEFTAQEVLEVLGIEIKLV